MCAISISFQSYHSCLLNWPKAVNEDVDGNINWNAFKKKKKISSELNNPVKVRYPSFKVPLYQYHNVKCFFIGSYNFIFSS